MPYLIIHAEGQAAQGASCHVDFYSVHGKLTPALKKDKDLGQVFVPAAFMAETLVPGNKGQLKVIKLQKVASQKAIPQMRRANVLQYGMFPIRPQFAMSLSR